MSLFLLGRSYRTVGSPGMEKKKKNSRDLRKRGRKTPPIKG
jgi:hypothetical protein